ncbi:hypothetical protein [Muriicola soli]|uniref:Right-handed parallel beta-helix repeat-containing protein n=1 Tax=Muriicola soli TaxID=2507538 RepID=A0A411E9D8_9FLAO|nr:hypothetical protein [Muriicola soli]QBA64345.1 hypothetical protein EQY75_07255 [Muriicola soli]
MAVIRYVLVPLVLFCGLIWISSCRKDFDYSPSTGQLEFSKDTVFLDTIFSTIGSSTYSLKVYNRTKEDIEIPSIRLGEGTNSQYRLNVDGQAGQEFSNVPLLARDSLYIFIETTYDIASSAVDEFLYVDQILFDEGANEQRIPLVTLVKEAIFLFPSTLANGSKESLLLGLDEEGNELRIEGFVLEDDELNFTADLPYVIYGYAAVAEDKVLSMAAGTRVFFHENSGILVGTGGSLKINGELSEDAEILENEVIFEGDRLEPQFAEVPGQWGTLWLAPGSIENEISYLTIRNATVGVLVEGNPEASAPTLKISNSQIYNSTIVNLWGRNTSIAAENLVLGNAGTHSLYCEKGGTYNFLHSTIANYWSNGFRTGSALRLSSFETDGEGNETGEDLLQANFINCIVDGNTASELSLERLEGFDFNFYFSHCLMKFIDSGGQFANDPLYDFTNIARYENILLNTDAEFTDPFGNLYTIGATSSALGNAELQTALLVPFDLLGKDRTEDPAIGAYEQ